VTDIKNGSSVAGTNDETEEPKGRIKVVLV